MSVVSILAKAGETVNVYRGTGGTVHHTIRVRFEVPRLNPLTPSTIGGSSKESTSVYTAPAADLLAGDRIQRNNETKASWRVVSVADEGIHTYSKYLVESIL